MNNLFLLLVLFVGFVYLKKSKKSFWIQIALLLVVCLLASDMIEGVENPAESIKQRGCGDGVKTFYAYFGRESAESAESGNRLYNRPPFYKPSNIDFADLKGELEFLKNEFLRDSQTYDNNTDPYVNGRKYGIEFIDKWVFKYKGDFGSFVSFQEQAVGPCGSGYPCSTEDTLITNVVNDYNNGNYLGVQKQGQGNYISSIGECPNLNTEDKINNKSDCLRDKGSEPFTHKVKVVNMNQFKNTCPTEKNPIIASYIGSVSFNDIVNREEKTPCSELVQSVYESIKDLDYPESAPNKDSESPIFQDLLNQPVNRSKLLQLLEHNDGEIFTCKMNNSGQYEVSLANTDLGEIGTI